MQQPAYYPQYQIPAAPLHMGPVALAPPVTRGERARAPLGSDSSLLLPAETGASSGKDKSGSSKSSSAGACSNSDPTKTEEPNTVGRWTAEEHALFLRGLEDHGKGWKKIASLIKTRTVVQIRTHAQKYFQKLAKSKAANGAGAGNSELGSLGLAPRDSHSPSSVGSAAVGGYGDEGVAVGTRRSKKRSSKRKASAAALDAAAAQSSPPAPSPRSGSRSSKSSHHAQQQQQQQQRAQQQQQQQQQQQSHTLPQTPLHPYLHQSGANSAPAPSSASFQVPRIMIPPQNGAVTYEPSSEVPPLVVAMDIVSGPFVPPAEGSPTSVTDINLIGRFPGQQCSVPLAPESASHLFTGQGNGDVAPTVDYDALLGEPDAPTDCARFAGGDSASFLRHWPATATPVPFKFTAMPPAAVTPVALPLPPVSVGAAPCALSCCNGKGAPASLLQTWPVGSPLQLAPPMPVASASFNKRRRFDNNSFDAVTPLPLSSAFDEDAFVSTLLGL